MTSQITRAEFEASEGSEIGLSGWFEITQDRIDSFADCTEDWQYIHVDPVKAAETPFGGTIAHGYLTLSLLGGMFSHLPGVTGTTMMVNYGLNRVRFIAPVPVGSRVRGRITLARVEEIRPDELQCTYRVTVEIEGQDRPALIADSLGRIYFGAPG